MKALPTFIISNLTEELFLSNSLLEPSKLVWSSNREKALRLTPKEAYHIDLKGIKCAVLEA